jgi:predicted GNAT superfamily acetyltransferase
VAGVAVRWRGMLGMKRKDRRTVRTLFERNYSEISYKFHGERNFVFTEFHEVNFKRSLEKLKKFTSIPGDDFYQC